MRRLSALAVGFLVGCSSQPSSQSSTEGPGETGAPSSSGGSSGSGGQSTSSSSSSSGGSTSSSGSGGSGRSSSGGSGGGGTTDSGGASGGGFDATVDGSGGGTDATVDGPGSSSGGGADSGGGGSSDAGDAGVVSAKSIVCNSVLGIDTTSEWFTGGFENQVPNAKWQIIYFHPGYVENWQNPNDPVWSTAITSACTTNSTNPDRVIFNAFSDPSDSTFNNAAAYAAGLTKVVANLKTKYPGLKRVDLLAMTRAPNNMPCVAGNRLSIVETWVDAAMSMVAAANPGFVTVAPPFYAPSCDDFADGGPHFTDAGKPIIANVYGSYYSTEP